MLPRAVAIVLLMSILPIAVAQADPLAAPDLAAIVVAGEDVAGAALDEGIAVSPSILPDPQILDALPAIPLLPAPPGDAIPLPAAPIPIAIAPVDPADTIAIAAARPEAPVDEAPTATDGARDEPQGILPAIPFGPNVAETFVPDPADPPGKDPIPEPLSPSPLQGSVNLASVAIGATAIVAAVAGLYSRFQKHTLLLSDARASIHAYIVEHPGATFADLARATGLRRGALVHHSHMLEAHGLAVSRHDGTRRRFYAPSAVPGAAPRPPTDSESRLLEVVAMDGPLTQSEIAARLEVSRQAVSEQVKRLARDGRLVPVQEEGKRRWMRAQ